MHPSDVPESRPAVAVSIADGIATVILEPHTAEMSDEVNQSLLDAARVRIFIDARVQAKLSRPPLVPAKATDYPADTLAFLVRNADLICAMVVDCREDEPPDEIEKIFAAFDTKETEDSRWAIRLFTDEPWSWGDHIALHRTKGAVCLASPIYKTDTAVA
jgi:hypothetical protein